MLSSLAAAAVLAGAAAAVPTTNLYPRDACAGNTAANRSTWCQYDINTDYYSVVPDTGVKREYWLDIQDGTLAPDGVSRYVQTINGSIPGPTLIADWGDTMIVHVTNSLSQSTNGTSIHFHGIRQNFTNQNDGAVSVTQCPTAPGTTTTYTWRATQYGTTWYHSHIGLQAWEGVFGGIIINGPASADYDEDLGVVLLSDWDHQTADELYTYAVTTAPPTLDTGLINGTNVFGADGASNQTGSRFSVSLNPGSSYRLRLINSAIDSHFKFSIDNHTLRVIANDLVSIQPFTTNVLNIGIGQRYDVIVTADQAAVANSFWMRAIPQAACSSNSNPDNIRGIVHYGSDSSTPNTTAFGYTDGCEDETVANLMPVISRTVGGTATQESENLTVTKIDGLFKWQLNGSALQLDWADPTLAQIAAANGSATFKSSSNVIALDKAGPSDWVYLAITTSLGVTHPIHLHGMDFYVLAQNASEYEPGVTPLNLNNPPRRDVAMLPGSGHLVVAFQTDNPGAWLMHCHIGWHTDEGLALQWVIRQQEALAVVDQKTLSDTCDAWKSYASSKNVTQAPGDDGI